MISRQFGKSKVLHGALLFGHCVTLWLVVAPVRAEMTLAIVPPYVEKIVRPGSKVRDTLSFTNKGDQTVVVSVDFADFAISETGEVSPAPPGSDVSSLMKNIRISPMEARVEPSQQVFFRYSVETPEAFEQLRTMVFLSSRPDVAAGANQVTFVARMGVPIYVENIKALPANLEIDDVRWERVEESPDRIRLSFAVTNVGQRNIRPAGFVHVLSVDRDFEQTFDFNDGREPVLPGQKRRWEQTFGPVANVALEVKLRMTTSPRHDLEIAGVVGPAGP